MLKPRSSRKRTTLRFLATMLVALGAVAFAASIALAANTTPIGGGHTPVTVCHKGKTLTFDDDGYQAHIKHGDLATACPPGTPVEEEEDSDPIISVCRDGAVVTIKTSEKAPTDGPVPCPKIINTDPDVTVCRANAAITIPTSQKLATDTTPPCSTPGAADAGGLIDQGDAPVDGVEYEHDSLAPSNASKDPAVGQEFAVAGAADAPATNATTVPGSGVSGAVAPANGQLPYTGLSTLQVALLGAMLLGMGALCWLVGSTRTEELAAA